MSTPAEQVFNQPDKLRDAFDSIIALKVRQKEIGEDIKTLTDDTCVALNIAPKAFNAALRWYGMTEGERADFTTALQLAQIALGPEGQGDLFSGDLEKRLKAEVVSFDRKRGRKKTPADGE